MDKLYIILISSVVLIIIGFIAWFIYRRDYRRFQRRYSVKLPFLCHVYRKRGKDAIIWGFTRWMHMRRDGGRDRRYAINFKIPYPTKITVCGYRLWLWRMNDAKYAFRLVQDYMWLQPKDLPFWGRVKGDLWKFFEGRKVRFIRHIAKMFEWYGWFPQLMYDKDYDILLCRNNNYYVVKCFFQRTPVQLGDLYDLGETVDIVTKIAVTNYMFTSGAAGYAKNNKICLMDGKRIDMSFELGYIMFIGRQG